MEPRPRRAADRQAHRRRRGVATPGVRSAWLRDRRRPARLQRRPRDFSGVARLLVLPEIRPAARGASSRDEGHRGLEHRAGPEAHGSRSRPGGSEAHGALPSRAPVHGAPRVPRAAGDAGAAVRRHAAVRHRDRRRAAAHLHRLDARVLRHHGDRPARDLGAVRLHRRRLACRYPDRRSPSRRDGRPPARVRLRESHRVRATSSGGRATLTMAAERPDTRRGRTGWFGIDPTAARVAWTILLIAGVLALVYILRHVLLLLAFSVFFAYLLFPLVAAAQRWIPGFRSRARALALVYLLLIAAVAIGG